MDPSFTMTLVRDHPPAELLRRALRPRAHDRLVPLTRVRADADALAAGVRFTATTALGPLRLVDEMLVEHWSVTPDGPCVARIAKTGSPLGGRISAVTASVRPGRSVLVWRQTLVVRGVPGWVLRLAAPVVALGYRLMVGRVVDWE